MPEGAGKYDDLAGYVRRRAQANTAIVMVIDGTRGTGFSVQSASATIERSLPAVLRQMADEIEGIDRSTKN